MITCVQTDGKFSIDGLSRRDLELIQEALHEAFNDSLEPQHRWYRTWVLEIDRAIDPAIEREHKIFRTK